MPRIGMEPLRRDALVKAAISEIGRVGSLDVTVRQIARQAGVSSALAHHYFGSKDRIFLAAMRHILAVFHAEVVEALSAARTPRQRLDAIVAACFSPLNFQPEVISAWLNFYVQSLTSPGAAHLLQLYHRRLQSNLMHDLRPLAGRRADTIAQGIAAMIDGVYIRQARILDRDEDGSIAAAAAAVDLVNRYIDMSLSGGPRG